MPYEATADVNYYQMEGEWELVQEPVYGGPFDTVEEAQAACGARHHDDIAWEDQGDGHWRGTIDPNAGEVIFRIYPVPSR